MITFKGPKDRFDSRQRAERLEGYLHLQLDETLRVNFYHSPSHASVLKSLSSGVYCEPEETAELNDFIWFAIKGALS